MKASSAFSARLKSFSCGENVVNISVCGVRATFNNGEERKTLMRSVDHVPAARSCVLGFYLFRVEGKFRWLNWVNDGWKRIEYSFLSAGLARGSGHLDQQIHHLQVHSKTSTFSIHIWLGKFVGKTSAWSA